MFDWLKKKQYSLPWYPNPQFDNMNLLISILIVIKILKKRGAQCNKDSVNERTDGMMDATLITCPHFASDWYDDTNLLHCEKYSKQIRQSSLKILMYLIIINVFFFFSEYCRTPYVVHLGVGRREYLWLSIFMVRLPCGHTHINPLDVKGCAICQSFFEEMLSVIEIR